jgi:S-DNA-T family DNA segregation ATPase FtsK/SpoIIIE
MIIPNESVTEDELYSNAVELAFEFGTLSTSLLQRRLSIGYGRAARLIDKLEEEGIISAPNENEPRKVLLTKEEYQARKQ